MRRPSELILKLRRDEPSKTLHLGKSIQTMNWLLLLQLYNYTKIFQIFPQGLYTPQYQILHFSYVEGLLRLFPTREDCHLPVKCIYVSANIVHLPPLLLSLACAQGYWDHTCLSWPTRIHQTLHLALEPSVPPHIPSLYYRSGMWPQWHRQHQNCYHRMELH